VQPNSSLLSGTPIARYQDGCPEARPLHRVCTNDPVIESSGQRAGSCRLLIVDDDIHMRTVVSAMTVHLGYSTRIAANGEEALQLLQNCEVDLVVTDYQMPLMNGYELASEIRRQYPDMPVILMTGYTNVDLIDPPQGQKLFAGLLNKPFNLQELGEKIGLAV
jgi:two-component system, cell cycle sensor histidine kinase and response regulator CckA